MKILLQIFVLSYLLWNCNSKETNEYNNYLSAINNQSTVQNFIVIKVKNKSTNEVKNICTTGNFLLGAIHNDLNIKYDSIGMNKAKKFAESKTNQYFEFKNTEALKNIDFYNYNEKLINDSKVNSYVKIIEEELKNKNKYSLKLNDSEMLAVAHNLLKKGYKCSENSCFGGSLIVEK